ncbi:MAG: class I SAM-dependent methyltransferase, partial [Gammaproteobacteria bacterium]|nr:class I SAM-dependent methyltransferase [Gammaproteobacteria bacterium]
MQGSISARNVNEIALYEILNSIKENFKEKEQVTILEIGSGAGAFIKHLKTELDQTEVNYIIEAGDIEPHQINNQDLGFKCNFLDAHEKIELGKKYDIIIAIELIEHIENPFHLIREISKNLVENGIV